VLQCVLHGWNAIYRVGMLPTGLECFRQCWNNFVQCWNAFCRVGMLSIELEFLYTELGCFLQGRMLSTGLECFLQGWNAFSRGGVLSTELEFLYTE
jgi:hypothetical protein